MEGAVHVSLKEKLILALWYLLENQSSAYVGNYSVFEQAPAISYAILNTEVRISLSYWLYSRDLSNTLP